jgi:MFS superfamily sulfate permease-like transporter
LKARAILSFFHSDAESTQPGQFHSITHMNINWYHLIFLNYALVIELWWHSHFEEIPQEDQIIIIIIIIIIGQI